MSLAWLLHQYVEKFIESTMMIALKAHLEKLSDLLVSGLVKLIIIICYCFSIGLYIFNAYSYNDVCFVNDIIIFCLC